MNTKRAESGGAEPPIQQKIETFKGGVEDALNRLLISADATNVSESSIESRTGSGVTGLVVAYSGGVDSHVLLKCVSDWHQAILRDSNIDNNSRGMSPASHATTLSLRAHHINHDLQAGSDGWVAHCALVCEQLEIEFTSTRVAVNLQSGHSPEDAARRARYAALQADLCKDEVLLVAQHADDQAETLLLQLFRGAGVNGLAAMPEWAAFGPGCLARPMLRFGGKQIRQYAKSQNLRWIEDPSNQDQRFDRNFLRNSVVPLLESRWPALAASVSRSASHCAEAAAVNRLYAEQLLGAQLAQKTLPLSLLHERTVAEKKVLLRCWFEHHGKSMPSARKLDHLLTDLVDASSGSAGDLSWGNARLRRYRDSLFLVERAEASVDKPFHYLWATSQPSLVIEETGQVLSRSEIPACYCTEELVVCNRRGGEVLRLAGHRHTRLVKKLFQECSIPPWQRGRLPFVYFGEQLIGVVGIGFTD